MTLAGQRSSIWYSLVTGRRYYHLAFVYNFITCLLECLYAYLLKLNAYLIARTSTCNGDSIPNCGALVLCEAHIQQLQG